MLDNEPDTEQNTPAASESAAPPAPRRRRAASRPAGPPVVAPAPTVAEPAAVAPEPAAAEVTSEPVVTAPVDALDAADEPSTNPLAGALAEPAPAPDAAPPGVLEPATSERPDPVSNPVADRLDALLTGAGPAEPANATDAPAEPETKPARRRPRKTAATQAPADEAPAERPARRRTRKAAAAPAAETDADDLVAEVTRQPVAPEPVVDPPSADLPEVPAGDLPGGLPAEVEGLGADDTSAVAPLEVAESDLAEAELDAGATVLTDEAVLADDAVLTDAVLTDAVLTDDVLTDDAVLVDEAVPSDGVVLDEPVDGAVVTDEDAVADEDEDDDAENEDADSGEGRRRRRRRGGRRRRRTGDTESDEPDPTDQAGTATEPVGSATDADDAPAADSGDDTDASGDEGSEEGDGSRRRRRRRRRRGEDTGGTAADDPTEVVVRVREPRKAKAAEDQVTGISGSTRMEAKRQRRREGRDAGRRRAPILSEAEFLARREAVTRRMIIRQREDLTQIAVLEDDILVEHYVDRESATSLIGNVYLGRVQNVLPSMEAAFVDIGRGRNAVLYAGEVDWDSFGAQGQNRKVEKVLKSGQTVLVQVTKDPVGAKGARLTNHVSIPGRYIVYAPSGHLSGISRKLPENERKRLKDILAGLVGEASVIVRTAAEGASEDELVRDVNRLQAQWSDIEAKIAKGQSPQQLYGEPDLTVRIVRDLFTEDFAELIVSGNAGPDDAYDAIDGYVQHVAPHLADRLLRFEPEDGDGGDPFARFRIDEQISKALERKVFLPSGGSLVIDRTEAMTVIDVNTGKFTGSGGNLEATVTSNNLEAAEEVVRQLRLRDLGGIIVIDFIDMVLPANRELLLRRLVECLGRDRTRHQVAEVTSLGLVQMTRKKIGTGLLEAFSTECEVCHGRGYEIHDEPVDSQRQADGGAREQRAPRRGGSGGPQDAGQPTNGHGTHGHGTNGHGTNGEPAGGGRSGRSRGGRGRRGSDDGADQGGAGEPDGSGTDPAIRAAVQHAIAEVAASTTRPAVDEVGS